MDDDLSPSWYPVILVTLILAVLLAICTWRALDALNAPVVNPTTTSIPPSTSR